MKATTILLDASMVVVVSVIPMPSLEPPCATNGGGHCVGTIIKSVTESVNGTLTYVSAPSALLQLATLMLETPDVRRYEMLMLNGWSAPAVGKGPSTMPSAAPAP